jgi:hypothetical protein
MTSLSHIALRTTSNTRRTARCDRVTASRGPLPLQRSPRYVAIDKHLRFCRWRLRSQNTAPLWYFWCDIVEVSTSTGDVVLTSHKLSFGLPTYRSAPTWLYLRFRRLQLLAFWGTLTLAQSPHARIAGARASGVAVAWPGAGVDTHFRDKDALLWRVIVLWNVTGPQRGTFAGVPAVGASAGCSDGNRHGVKRD